MSASRVRRTLLAAALGSAGVLVVGASGTSAATIRFGQVAPAPLPAGRGVLSSTYLQYATAPASPSYTVPPADGGVITSWSIEGDTVSSGPVRLRVFRPTGVASQYLVVGDSIDEAIPGGVVSTFPTHIVVRPGDVIGLRVGSFPVLPTYSSTSLGDQLGAFGRDPVVGSTYTLSAIYSATLLDAAVTLQTPDAAFTPPSPIVSRAATFDASPSSSGDSIVDYTWSFGDGTALDAGTTPAVSHTYAATGAYTATLTITDSDGNTATASHTVTVTNPPPPSPPPPPTPAPVITAAAQTHARWRVGSALATLARVRPPIGTAFTFQLNVPASVTLAFVKPAAGYRVGTRCVAAPVSHRHHAPRCNVPAGTLAFPGGHAGLDTIAFQGRFSRSQRLAPGSYNVLISARNAIGTSLPATLHFTVVR